MPDWADPVAHYMLHEGLTATLRIAAYAVIGSTLIGVLLGTLLTIRFRPLRALIRLYVEVWRGLPILVTIFLVYFALPTTPVIHHRFGAITGAAIGLILWGSAQVAEATRGAVQSIPSEQHEAAAALGFGVLLQTRLGTRQRWSLDLLEEPLLPSEVTPGDPKILPLRRVR